MQETATPQNASLLACIRDIGVGLDLNQHLGRDERADLNHGGGRPNPAKKLAMGSADLLPIRNIDHKHPSADDVFQGGPGHVQSSFNIFQSLHSLGVRISPADNVPIGSRGRSPRDVNMGTEFHRARVSDDGFPGCAARKISPFYSWFHDTHPRPASILQSSWSQVTGSVELPPG